jgi:hypothetical protein
MTTGQRDVRTEASHPWTLTLLPWRHWRNAA